MKLIAKFSYVFALFILVLTISNTLVQTGKTNSRSTASIISIQDIIWGHETL